MGPIATSDPRALSLVATLNPTIIFIILIIIFNLSTKNFMCFNLFKKNYDFSLIVMIVF
jgi:uncharacterized integral membrane protein